MKKVLIIGGGFAGIAALQTLSCAKDRPEVFLIDARREHNFLPLLPDIIGRGISPEYLLYNLEDLSKRPGFTFINEEVISVDLQSSEVTTTEQRLDYDYLILACGSQTNFYGQKDLAAHSGKLDNAKDAQDILAALKGDYADTLLVAGGGYTGIEIASNLRLYLNKVKQDKKIVIVEAAGELLGPLPKWMKDYVGQNLKKLNIDILLNSKLERIEGEKLYISRGKLFDKAMLIWAAGVKTADFIFNLNSEKGRQGRLKVDEYLRLNQNCFAAGDAAEFSLGGKPLRMAVQFSIAQGRLAAANILRAINARALKGYRPRDLGYIIPMANNRSCGIILGVKMLGKLPTVFHYLMCIYRSFSWRNKIGIIRDLIKRELTYARRP